ncbi:D-alanyl-D-alanine carboxypeptidase (penicillin-binding protein 5/6) [Cerasibacillus quisquiliarum]|uniref:serine-type D-Ala-D-Ala carboxypeptidase n=1 Tax=Cerasibacillus quisquiliarum TaxID=227865 RepID=A0A511V1G6_9BACI|nr:D-alanyl-D-alanine carboxypeptidase family protein [Cerasibacillus quisquiliarum]MBB5145427.1 D-alanyl-D-alanine carboxypeptidase (penicillin-binding protein 5/6) [Cerasibacillus quisquiliarum]GEN31861.1 D-alanyl-D-alanine carboxypeptidase DacF [Cerasibacillus quisquiliarum]
MRTILYLFISLLLIFSIITPVFAQEENQSLELAADAKSAMLMEQDTGKIIFEKNANEKLPPASMVKIMTLLIVMEEIDKGNLKKNEMVRISENASSMGGSQVFLEAGEEMSVEDLIKSVAIASGNDASVALAERISGSEQNFVNRMNEKAIELQLKNTQFKNATGLPAKGQYSTAHDMAIIAKALLQYDDITTYTSIYEDYLRKGKKNEFWLVNTNKLVRFYPGVDGLKTGYTSEAKYCLTATAKKNDMRMITVVMGADTVKKRNHATSEMLDYAFNHYETEQLFDKGEVIKTVPLLKAEKEHIQIVTEHNVRTIYKKEKPYENIKTYIEIDQDLSLPLKKGEQVGVLTVKANNQELSKTPLIVASDIKEASFITLLKRTLGNMSKAR